MRWVRARADAAGTVACVEYSGVNAYGARRQAFAALTPGGATSDSAASWNAHCLGGLPIVTSTAARLDGR